jgi:hypothetical protein
LIGYSVIVRAIIQELNKFGVNIGKEFIMSFNSSKIKQYQILGMSANPLGIEFNGLRGVISFYSGTGPGLIYVEPEQLYNTSSLLEQYGGRVVVFPDYVFIMLVRESKKLGFNIQDVEFTDNSRMGLIAKRFIEVGDNSGLLSFLEESGEPITAISLRDEQIEIKLYGSGLVTIQSSEDLSEDKIKQIFKRLDNLLVKSLIDSELWSESKVSFGNKRFGRTEEQDTSWWHRFIGPRQSTKIES